MKHFKCSLRMCFPHKVWVKELQRYQSKHHNHVKCKEKFKIERIEPTVAYIYDDNAIHRSYVCKGYRPDTLSVNNWSAWHICVDGGLIRYGSRNYMFSFKYPQGRCDSIIFDSKDLWFIEFKMNTTTHLDGQLWADFSDGMVQLKDFILNLRRKMVKKHTPLHRYYGENHQHCTICMNSYPNMSLQRNNQLESFRIETGIKLQQLVAIP